MAQYEKQHQPDRKLLAVLGAQIRDIRGKKQLTIEQLSTRADINYKYLQRCETGRSNPSFSILLAISQGLDMPLDRLIKAALTGGPDRGFPAGDKHIQCDSPSNPCRPRADKSAADHL
ncbi:MAG: helix-turn-helix domain-containing protein [Candidatus Margulisbacteria bacterium]|nr:helix-turn-helix domain-containing protein [Candidatus Margulisiibacteriota bacterium]